MNLFYIVHVHKSSNLEKEVYTKSLPKLSGCLPSFPDASPKLSGCLPSFPDASPKLSGCLP